MYRFSLNATISPIHLWLNACAVDIMAKIDDVAKLVVEQVKLKQHKKEVKKQEWSLQ